MVIIWFWCPYYPLLMRPWPPPWASQLRGQSQYPPTSPSHPLVTHAPMSKNPYTAKKQCFQPRREASLGLVFQSSSAPSPLQSNVPPMTCSYSCSESVSISDDHNATIQWKKSSPLQEELPKDRVLCKSLIFSNWYNDNKAAHERSVVWDKMMTETYRRHIVIQTGIEQPKKSVHDSFNSMYQACSSNTWFTVEYKLLLWFIY